MKHVQMFAIVAMAAALGSIGCNKVEGVYTLDKEAMKKAIEAESTEKPDDAASQEMLMAFVDELDARMELAPGGTVTLTSKWGGKEAEPRKGTWKDEGKAIVLEIKDERIRCNKDGAKKLACGGEENDDKQKLVFVKTANK